MALYPAPKPPKKKKKGRKKLLPLPSLIKKADRVFHKFIRGRDRIELSGKCCTCNAIGTEAGHFVKASNKKIRWHPQNVHLQCTRCNRFLDGNEAEYAKFIIERYGIQTFHWLLAQKGVYKVTREELNQIIEAYS